MTSDELHISELPDAVEAFDSVWDRFAGRIPVLFADYDGTLTPIVDDPAEATLGERTREALASVARHVPVAIISGRDLQDVRGHVDMGEFSYAGSHGFDMRLADGSTEQYGTEYLEQLDAAETSLRRELAAAAGVHVERKRFAIAVHFRRAAPDVDRLVEEVVARVAGAHAGLRITGGKEIFELRPDMEWDKGHALARLIDVLGLEDGTHAPVYLGDDLTDEDGFTAVNDAGVSVVVAGERDRPTIAQYRLDDTEAVRVFLERLGERAAKAGLAAHVSDDEGDRHGR